MKRSFPNILVFIFLFLPFLAFSQTMKISGTVVDTNIFQPLYGAKAYLVHVEDSVITDHKNTDRNGFFSFEMTISNYRLFISHPSYADKEFLFVGSKENYEFDLGEIQLEDESMNFDEIAVYAYKDPMYYRGDTLVYIADSFATQQNAVVEDLLKQLPGIVVETDGSISSQGKQISKVYVDGDEFFGSDPTIATKNLAAKSIDKVHVYEVDPEDGSLGDEKIQILDLRLKDDAKKGWFGKAIAATDFQRFYEGQLLFNRFTNNQKIFAFGIGSNTLNASISQEDAAAAGLGRGMTGGNARNGYPQTFRAGVMFSQKVNDKFKFDGNYMFTDSRVTSETEKSTQYLLNDTTYYSDQLTERKTMSQKHDLSLNFNIDIDSSQTLRIAPRVGYSISGNENNKTEEYFDENREGQRRATNISENDSKGWNASARINYIKRFRLPSRTLTISDNVSYNQNKGVNYLNYEDFFLQTELTDNEILQRKENASANFSNTLMASYSEPLSDKWSLIFEYELFNNRNDQNRYSYDFDGDEYSTLDSLTSDVFKTTRLQNKLGVSARYNSKSHFLTFGVRERNLIVNNDNLFTDDKIYQNVFSTLPYANYRYRISQNSSFTTSVSTNSSLPSISYLSSSRDNSNPNAVMEGNENLKPNYNVTANVNYNLFKRVSEINFSVGASARYTFNDFARSLSYDEIGRSVSVYENINTFNSVSGRTNLTIPVLNRMLRINPRFNYTNSNQNNIVDGVNNITNTHNYMPELRLMLFTNVVEFTTSVRFTKQIGKNTANANLNIENTIWNFNNELTLNLPWKIELKATGNYYNYANLSQAFNSNFFVLNASLMKRFGKYDEWQVGVEGYDLLNKNTQIERILTANTIVDTRNDIISRYFLFRVSYTFNSTMRIKPTVDND